MNFEAGRFVQAFFVLGIGLRFLRSLLCENSFQEKTEETEGLKWGLGAWIKLTSQNSLVLSLGSFQGDGLSRGTVFPGGRSFQGDGLSRGTVFPGGQTNCREASEKHSLIAIEMLVDAAGRSIDFQIKNDAGNVLSYCGMTFEAKERVKDITDNLGVHVMAHEGETSRVLGVSTKDANDLTREILNRGYGYNDRSEVVGGVKHHPDGDAIPAASFAYDFDGIGNRKTHTIGDFAPVSYTPDSLNQYAQVIGNEQAYIVGRTAEGAAVTINGQPAAVEEGGFFSGLVDLNNDSGPSVTEVTIDADKAGKQTQETGALRSAPASATWQYDDDGNLLSDGLWDYTWNGENRLIAAETVATIPAAYRVKKEYVYDYRGRRVEETKWKFDETSNDYSLEQQLRSIYDDWNPVVEIVDDQPSRHYVWGLDLSETPQGAGGVAGLLMSLDLTHASLSYSFVYDGNGNVLGVTNLANGELIGRYEYSPFGKLLWKEGLAAEINRWRFSTKLEDDGMGWLYYGFRYYEPDTGRWPSRDPIGESGGINVYGFLVNAPINHIDTLGLDLISPCPIDKTLKNYNIKGYKIDQVEIDVETNSGAIQVQKWFRYSGNPAAVNGLAGEIVSRLIKYPNQFYLPPAKNSAVSSSQLKKHVQERIKFINFLKNTKCNFGNPPKLNGKYWNVGTTPTGGPTVVPNLPEPPGTFFEEAMKDLIQNDENEAGCFGLMQLFAILQYQDIGQYGWTPSDPSHWIPGDISIIINTDVGRDAVRPDAGQNIAYLGDGKWWGLIPPDGGETKDSVKNWIDWTKENIGPKKGAPPLESLRRYFAPFIEEIPKN